MKRLLLIGLFISVGFSQKEYNINHIIEHKGFYYKRFSSEIVNGKVYKMYGDMKAPLGFIIGGKKSGLWTYWHENGLKMQRGDYKDGEKDGLWTGWYQNGLKAYEATYKDANVISSKKWDKDGNLIESKP